MVLSDRDIKRCLESGRIKVSPAPDLSTQLGPCSIDLRLAETFRVFERSRAPFIDTQGTACDDLMREVVVALDDMFIMQPGELVLASTHESLELADDLLARLEGRSSLARLGIIVHGTAGVFEPGWRGRPTLELGNLGPMPVALHPLMRICSFTFEELSSPSDVPYWKRATSKYLGQKGADPSRFYSEKDAELRYRENSTREAAHGKATT
ncbi:MAG: dCTP deaminase [Chloroflexi bacterium]|nr:dCTP deaminase [Chloroflexota bacterium]